MVVCMAKAGTPTDNITVEIQGDDSSKPDKSTITNGTSDTLDGSTLTSTANRYTWASFTFGTNPVITSGTKYWITLNRVNAPDAANYYRIVSYNASTYAGHGNSTHTLSTGVWTSENSTDYAIYVELEIDGDTKVYKLDADNKNILNYVGWTKDNVAADAAINVIYGGEIDTLTGLTTGRKVYASTTAGAYSHTPPTTDGAAAILLGTATGSDSLLIEKKNISMGDDTSTCLGGVGTGVQNIAVAPAITGTMSVFVKTGFRPGTVEANADSQISAAATYIGVNMLRQSSAQVQETKFPLDNSRQYTTASTAYGAVSVSTLAIGALQDNGFYVAAGATNNAIAGNAKFYGWIAKE